MKLCSGESAKSKTGCKYLCKLLVVFGSLLLAINANGQAKKPNIVIIWGDDIGLSDVECLLNGTDEFPHAQHRPHRQ